MKIGIDGDAFMVPHKHKGGIGRYALELLDRLTNQPDDSYKIIIPGIHLSRLRLKKEIDRLFRERFKNKKIKVHWMGYLPGDLLHNLWTKFKFPPVDLWEPNIELYHGIDCCVPPLKKAVGVLTVHDLAFLIHPEFYDPKVVRTATSRIKASLPFCNRVITVSESTKRDFLKFFQFPEEKIHVIHLGPSAAFSKINDRNYLDKSRDQFHFPAKFALAVSTLQPRKNFVGLIQAFLKALPKLPKDFHLLIAGLDGWSFQNIYGAAATSVDRDRIIFLGHVPDEKLNILYNLASFFIFPSFYEGFGCPLVEAMACGTPILAANNSATPEIVGNSALLFDARDIEGMSTSMIKMFEDSDLRINFSTQGLERAKKFSFDKMAKETRVVYSKALGN